MKSKKVKAFLILLVGITMFTSIIMCVMNENVVEALSKYGSRGQEVRTIQDKLKRWGYYTGNVDGIYGSLTVQAVKYFQRKNNLSVDGIAGPETLKALGIMSSSGSSSSSGGNSGSTSHSSDVNLLSRLIYGEARGEPYTGQVAVAAVVLNRVKSSSFPNTIAGVVYQSRSF